MMRGWLTGADLLLILVAGTLIGWLYVALWSTERSTAVEVEIWSRGERLERLPLAEDRRIEAPGALGTSLIEIKQARARFVASPCTNKVCILSGSLHHPGETAACLPNQVSLRILGRDPRYDAINF